MGPVLAYVTGLVNQKLLLQNEYLAAENRILRAHLPPVCGFPIPSDLRLLRSANDWAALRFSRWVRSDGGQHPSPIRDPAGTQAEPEYYLEDFVARLARA